MSGESEQGLSIFDWVDNPGFPTVRRHGYDQVAVDAYVRSHSTDAETARAQAQAAREECESLRREIARLTADLSDAGIPTESALAGQVAEMLIESDTRAKQILASGDADAAEIRGRAEYEASSLRKRVEREIAEIRAARIVNVERDHSDALQASADARTAARSAADDLITTARQEADQRRRSTQEESDGIRATTTRAADEARATADAELAEARRDIEAERTGRQREERESHHATRRRAQELAEQAEGRVREIEDRARQATSAVREHHDASRAEADRELRRARRRAEQILSETKSWLANEVLAETTALDRRKTRLLADIERLQRRESAMRMRVGELRDMAADLRGIEHDPEDDPHDA